MGVVCSQCGVPVSEGAVCCHNCGCDLEAKRSAAPEARPAAGESASAANAMPVLESRGEEQTEVETPDSPVRVAVAAARTERAAPAVEPAVEFDDDCPDFRIEYDAVQVFMEGFFSPFRFRLMPRREGIEDLSVEIRYDGSTGRPLGEVAPDEIIHKGKRLSLNIPYKPTTGISGKIAFDLYIGYTIEGEKQIYKGADLVYTVFPVKEQPQSMLQNLKIEFHNTINQGHAGDIHLAQHMKELDALQPRWNDSAETIFQKLDLPPVWKPLELCRCRSKPGHVSHRLAWPGPENAPPAARVQRLALETRNRTVFVYADARLVVGRNKQCDLVTHVRDAQGRRICEESRVGRFHLQLEAKARECEVHDRAWYPDTNEMKNSRWGTFLDGKRIWPDGGVVRLPVDRPFTLSLGRSSISENDAFGFVGKLFSAEAVPEPACGCEREGETRSLAGLVLKDQRCDRESWAIVWKALPLAALDPAWGQGCLCRCGEGFLVRVENRCEWLVPGRPMVLPGMTLQVNRFEKGCI